MDVSVTVLSTSYAVFHEEESIAICDYTPAFSRTNAVVSEYVTA